MKKLIFLALILSPLCALESTLEYTIKPNGIMVYHPRGARVPKREEQKDVQVLNPEFCDTIIASNDKEESTEIAQIEEPKKQHVSNDGMDKH